MAKIQLVDCTVRLSGQLTHTVEKTNVSVPEIVILRAVHGGQDSVINIDMAAPSQDETVIPRTKASWSIGDEMARLRTIYGPKVVDAIFPGHNPRLPMSMRQLEQEGGDAQLPADNDAGLSGSVIVQA